jgi:predicted nucleotidyltransferase
MSGLPATLLDLVGFLEGAGVDYMVIGGFALPFYGRIRSTLDIDVAVKPPSEESFSRFVALAREKGFTPTVCSYSNPVSIFIDEATRMEVELWTRPDGVEWDEETLGKRRRVQGSGVSFWIISPEDFIVSKLARPDRVEQDELDVKSVLTLKESELDADYLEMRAKKFGIYQLLAEIKRR